MADRKEKPPIRLCRRRYAKWFRFVMHLWTAPGYEHCLFANGSFGATRNAALDSACGPFLDGSSSWLAKYRRGSLAVIKVGRQRSGRFHGSQGRPTH